MAQEQDKLAASERRNAYRQWLDGGATFLHNGTRKLPGRAAFRFLRTADGWAPAARGPKEYNEWQKEFPDQDDPEDWEKQAKPEQQHDAILNHQAEVELAADEWAALWNEGGPCFRPPNGPLGTSLPPLTAQDIRAAAETVPHDTGLGADNLAPRAIAALPTQQLQHLADLLNSIEDTRGVATGSHSHQGRFSSYGGRGSP